jgi:bifunctional aspartokinase / homoserine dehydrogenase 1
VTPRRSNEHQVTVSSRAAPTTDVVLVGVGGIGRELVDQLTTAADSDPARLRVCGLVDRSGYLFNARGIPREELRHARARKADGGSLAQMTGASQGSAFDVVNEIATRGLSRPVIVDLTAADTSALLRAAFGKGCDAVLANKVPLATDQCVVDELFADARRGGRRVLHEATVGAGLPVIDTLRKLRDGGDDIVAIEGCPSGTLGYLFGELSAGQRFSNAIESAIFAGFTEPDPRTDLSGIDVARKALILARLIGFRGNLSDVTVESLVPPDFALIGRDEFIARTGELDDEWARRVHDVHIAGRVLRYRARITPQSVTVGLVPVPLHSALGTLSGTDNQFAFTTTRYHAQPLVITGPGAGAAVTAAGVHNDLRTLWAEHVGHGERAYAT